MSVLWKMIKINKNSWHYRVRLQWQDFVSVNAGRKINLDASKTTKTSYIVDVILGYYLTLISPLADLLTWILIKTKLSIPLMKIVYLIKNREKNYVKFV